MNLIDPETFVEADYLYFGEDLDSQGIVRPVASGPFAQVVKRVEAEPSTCRKYIFITVGEPSIRLVDGRAVENLRPQYSLEEVLARLFMR